MNRLRRYVVIVLYVFISIYIGSIMLYGIALSNSDTVPELGSFIVITPNRGSQAYDVKNGDMLIIRKEGSGIGNVVDGTAERPVLKIPFLGYAIDFAMTRLGLVVCIIIPSGIMFFHAFVMAVDERHNSSRHRKRIVRSKRRRKERYLKEGLTGKKGAMI